MLKEPEARDLAPLEAAPATRPRRRGGMFLVGLAIGAAALGGLICHIMHESALRPRRRWRWRPSRGRRRSSKSFIR